MNSLLSIFPSDNTVPIENISDRFIFGALMVLIGMIVVFAVLIVIWFTLILFQKAFAGTGKKAPAPKPVVIAPEPVYAPCETEIVAVIAAAIAAAEAENDGLKFRVVSFKRK